jgi:uncharacterized membrane protein YoaK (UPF0700 family)
VTGADPGRREVALLLVMVVAAAATDAISYLGLGKVFPANMTGNTVLLGIGLATGDMTHAAHSGVALGGFVLGAAFAGGRPHGPARWARGPSLDAYVETALVLAAFLWWHLGAPPKMALIGMLAIAMGMQSAAITRLDLGVSTTFITGTWTSASAWLGRLVTGTATRRGEREPESAPSAARHAMQAVVVAWYLAIACLAAYVFSQWHSWALLIPAAALAVAGASPLRVRTARSG